MRQHHRQRRLAWCLPILVVAGLTTLPTTAQAQVEITPTIGYRWGGELRARNNALVTVDADLDSDFSYGLVLDFPVSRHFQIELLADRQETRLRTGRLFDAERPGVDLDVTYYHVGMLWQWYPRTVRPYIVASLGVADLDPHVTGARSEHRFSASIGGGVKVPVSDHVAFRLEARVFGADTDSSCYGHHDDCNNWHHNDDWDDERDLAQGEVKVGVSFSF